MSTKRIANISMLIALAIIFSYVEVLIPISIGIPGIKMGLANIVIVIALYSLNLGDVWMISIIRIFIIGIMFGNFMSIAYSLSGAVVSLTIMAIIKKSNILGIMGTSIIGGVSHNIAQLLVAMFVVSNKVVLYYMPVLIIAGVITGAMIGILSQREVNILKDYFF